MVRRKERMGVREFEKDKKRDFEELVQSTLEPKGLI